MRFKEFLLELFDSKIEYEVDKNTSEKFSTKAKIGTKLITFIAVNAFPENEIWEVSFSFEDSDNVSYKASNDGRQLEVLSFVKRSMIEFIDRYHPRIIEFTASKENEDDSRNSRALIYKKMLKDVESHGYSLKSDEMTSSSMEFTLTKI